MIWSIAWKNIGRNRRRSLVVILAVTIGIISGVMLVGIMEGWVKQRLVDAISNEVSHIQVHHAEFVKNEEIDLCILRPEALVREIRSIREISGWVQRVKLTGMAVTPWANTGVVIYGIDPEKEKTVTGISGKMVPGAGKYIHPQHPSDILISDKTAEILKLKHYVVTDSLIGELITLKIPGAVIQAISRIKDERYRSPKDFNEGLGGVLSKSELKKYGPLLAEKSLDYRIRSKIQLTFSNEQGTPVQGIFRVCGIYKTTNTGYDQVTVFVNAGELTALCGNGLLIHEMAIMLHRMEDVNSVQKKLAAVVPENSVRSWKELAPDAAMMNDYMIVYYFIFIGIILLALAFGIINTMLMAIMERTKELGMLMAIGMNRRRIFHMIMLETIFLTMAGAVAGMLLGWIIITTLGKSGIHFSGWGEGYEAIGFAARVYPVITPQFFVSITAMVILTAMISSIWPARKALKLKPVEALRTD